ncbi:zinc finger MYM-type 1-like, partial [Pelobates cultripes]
STSTIAVSASSATSGSTDLDYENITEQQEEIYSNDIGDWNICDALREYFCENGVTNCQHIDSDFSASEKICPGETFTRHCTKSLFFREQLNGEKVKRDWLCYSPKTGKVFCALCKLFSKDETTHLTSTGYSDWRHATRDLSRHENSASHGKAIEVLIRRKTSGQRIDKDLVNQFENQKKYWHKILCRILSVIKLLSSRGLSFRGNNEVIGSVHNGNYLGYLELLAEYDPFLDEHIQKHGNKGRGHISYLSSTICDEFIELIGQQLLQQIVNEMKQAKYYSISLDSTPDIAHSDQLTIIFRYVLASGPVERFTKFIPISGHTGMELANTVLQFLEENGISIKDCRGQSYDNASNMSGKYNGMQALIREKNPLAEYIPCCAHSLNLVGQNAVNCCPIAVSFFNFVQQLYCFFSSSTHRWNLLTNRFKTCGIPTLKRLADTRWSAHHDAVNALQKGYTTIKEVLANILTDENTKGEVCLQAKGLSSVMDQLEMGIMIEIWSVILPRFHRTSQSLQDAKLDLHTATGMLDSLKDFVQSLRSRFSEFEQQGKDITCCDEYQLQRGRKIKRNKKWDYGDAEDADADMTPSEKFKVNTFYLIIDQLAESLRHRQAAYSVIQERFSLLLEMCTLATDGLFSKARTLVTQYPEDLDPLFEDEIVQFASLFKIYQSSPAKKVINESQELQMYKFLVTQSLVGAFPYTHVTLRMYLCLMVSNCSGERSFSTLKRVKNELRSSMGQERLNALSLLCIENGLLNELNLDSTIEEFASKKARKANV